VPDRYETCQEFDQIFPPKIAFSANAKARRAPRADSGSGGNGGGGGGGGGSSGRYLHCHQGVKPRGDACDTGGEAGGAREGGRNTV
jgi:hypothetical protein